MTEADIEVYLAAVGQELRRAIDRFPAFNSAHEGKAVIEEELEELWDAVKANDTNHARKEAVQVAAMAVRFLIDIPHDQRQADVELDRVMARQRP